MNRVILVSIALLLVPSALALSTPDPCANAPGGTCAGISPVVPATQVGAGQTAVFDGRAYIVTGLITVANGGTLLAHGTTFDFDDATAGITVEQGGTLVIDSGATLQSTLGPTAGNPPFLILAKPGSSFSMDGAQMLHGSLNVSDVNAIISNVKFRSTPVVVTGATTTLRGNSFFEEPLALSLIGGSPTLRQATFQGVDTCIVVESATFALENSILNQCDFGVIATNSRTTASFSAMDDRLDPDSIGFNIIGGTAEISNCHLKDWGTAIHGSNGAVIDEHDNTFTNNLVDVG